MPTAIPQPPPIHTAEVAWLTSDEASRWLEELAQSELPIHLLATKLRRELSANRTHMLLEQAELRRRAAAKFTRASQMLFTARGLEQATDEWIARYKAQRFCRLANVADLCCGIGGDSIGLSNACHTTSVDCDPSATYCVTHNLRVYHSQPTLNASVDNADVESVDVENFNAWHLDPDRRPQGRRTTRVELHEPSLAAIDRLLSQQASAAIKLAPAADLPLASAWAAETEFEWISRGGECRQLVAWRGDLAEQPGFRRATRVYVDRVATFIGTPEQTVKTAGRVERYLFEPDTAILAAQLTGALAIKHGLKPVAAGVAYLTGDDLISDRLLSAFEVVESMPFDRRALAAFLRAKGIGRVEIKHRGLELDPEKLRKELKLRGDNEATLLLTMLDQRATVLFANRVAMGSDENPRAHYAETSTDY